MVWNAKILTEPSLLKVDVGRACWHVSSCGKFCDRLQGQDSETWGTSMGMQSLGCNLYVRIRGSLTLSGASFSSLDFTDVSHVNGATHG